MPPMIRSTAVKGIGATLRQRRAQICKRQEDVANDAEVSQKLISELERGEQDLSSVGIGRVSNIARALDWTLNELQEATGLDFGIENIIVAPAAPKRLRKLPRELEEMIDEKAELAPELATERWQQYLAGQRFSTGKADKDRWWNLYLTLKNAGIEPGGN